MSNPPVAHWTMDNVSGTTLIDEIGTYNGTIANMPQTDSGKFDKYLAGGSVASVIRNVSFSPFVPFKSLSIWFRASTLSGDLRVLYIDYAANEVIYFYNSVLQVNADGNQTCSLSLPDTDWHHLAIVEGSSNNYHWIYLDGVKDTSERRTNAGGTFQMFGSGGISSTSLVPDFDNIQVYDYKLTDTEIAYLASATAQTQTLPIPLLNKVSGVVTVNGSPAARTVAVFRRSDFTLLGTTTSNATTGAFEILNGLIPADANALLVTSIDSTGTYNAVSVDYITSVA